MKWVDRYEKTGDEGKALEQRRITRSGRTDVEQRKYGEQKGLETPVVHTVNDVHEFEGLEKEEVPSGRANALNVLPGEYNRKVETQRISRVLNRLVEHAI